MLPISVFGPVSWFATIKASPKPVFDVHEHFIKQTWRSRYAIATANGLQTLSIPTIRKNHTPIHEVMIDYQRKWPSEHLKALETAYKKAPFFDHYLPCIEETLLSRKERLVDLFNHSYSWLSPTLALPEISVSQIFTPYAVNDFRLKFDATHPMSMHFNAYAQVFDDRCSFDRDLSILDLIFNLGPESMFYLNECAAFLQP
jgi:hypothetical protein